MRHRASQKTQATFQDESRNMRKRQASQKTYFQQQHAPYEHHNIFKSLPYISKHFKIYIYNHHILLRLSYMRNPTLQNLKLHAFPVGRRGPRRKNNLTPAAPFRNVIVFLRPVMISTTRQDGWAVRKDGLLDQCDTTGKLVGPDEAQGRGLLHMVGLILLISPAGKPFLLVV